MTRHYHTIVIGGGCLGTATAISLARKLPGAKRRICLIEKAVLGAGLSSRHSAIVRSANASPMAARLARQSTALWKNLPNVWGVAIPYEQPGALWIGRDSDAAGGWHRTAASLREVDIELDAIDRNAADELTGRCLRLDPDDLYFYEPDVLQLEAGDVLQALQSAAEVNAVDLREHTRVIGFEDDGVGRIRAVKTSHGRFGCDFVVNASGGWSPALMETLGRRIPVALEPVYVANWLVSSADLPRSLPIVADYVHRAYFRRWRGSILHMHQPRQRGAGSIATNFSRSVMNPAGADIIYDAANFAVTQQQLEAYAEKVRRRFARIGSPIHAGGYVSFFDITPDLNFILGFDTEIGNLVHCLGAGQALKYAPVFGELLAELILEGRLDDPAIDLTEFSIGRFPADRPPRFGRIGPASDDAEL